MSNRRAGRGNSSDREWLSTLYAARFHPGCDRATSSAHDLRSVTRGIFVRFPYVVEPQQGDDRDQSQVNPETNINGIHTGTAFCGRASQPGPWNARLHMPKSTGFVQCSNPRFSIGCAGGRQSRQSGVMNPGTRRRDAIDLPKD
jgi:hypothetical protein